MTDTRKVLLAIDGALNVLFGLVLLAFPTGFAVSLGLPPAASAFYPSILGAVLTAGYVMRRRIFA